MRKELIERRLLTDLAIFGTERVFKNVSRKTCILVIGTRSKGANVTVHESQSAVLTNTSQINPTLWLSNHNVIFTLGSSEQAESLRRKIEQKSNSVGNIYYVNYGAQISSKVKGAFKQDRLLGTVRKGNSKKCLCGSSVKRYEIVWEGYFLDYQPRIMYGPRDPIFFESKKIIFNKTSSKGYGLLATFDDAGFYCDQRVVCLVRYENLVGTKLRLDFVGYERKLVDESELYHTGLLNSSLMKFWYSSFVATKNLQGEYSDVVPKMIRGLPLRSINFRESSDKLRYDLMVRLVGQMLEAKTRLTGSKSDKDKNYYENKCASLDRQIDKLVYELYDLTEDEIKIVEAAKVVQ